MSDLGPLRDGGRVVIVGGGPSGVACALVLQKMAARDGRRIQITVLEGKQFSGARHHNLCVGVLSPPLPALLGQELGIAFPGDLEYRAIRGYILHTARDQVVLDEGDEPSLALRRIQFDDNMLQIARQRGVEILRARAVDLDFHDDHAVVYTENVPLEADVVVGAFGMDDGCAAAFSRATGYRPPEAMASVVTRFHPGPEAVAGFAAHIHAFLHYHPHIEFGAITPKDDHLTINVAGRAVSDADLADFLTWPEVQTVLPNFGSAGQYDATDLKVFKGRFPCSLAGHYYGDRYVTVGDAAGLVRAFKGKGVTSAIITGMRAAETIYCHGISAQAFAKHYAVANQDITGDLPYGRSTRWLVNWSVRYQLLDPVLRASRRNHVVREALLGAVSGNLPYRQVMRDMLRAKSVAAVLGATLGF